jgi:hypothetical protein
MQGIGGPVAATIPRSARQSGSLHGKTLGLPSYLLLGPHFCNGRKGECFYFMSTPPSRVLPTRCTAKILRDTQIVAQSPSYDE